MADQSPNQKARGRGTRSPRDNMLQCLDYQCHQAWRRGSISKQAFHMRGAVEQPPGTPEGCLMPLRKVKTLKYFFKM